MVGEWDMGGGGGAGINPVGMRASRSDWEEELGLKACHGAGGVKNEVAFVRKMNDGHGLALMFDETKIRAVP